MKNSDSSANHSYFDINNIAILEKFKGITFIIVGVFGGNLSVVEYTYYVNKAMLCSVSNYADDINE
jgi:uncharacterized membrane protein YiaA